MKRDNVRSLDLIADDINKLERGNIFDIGDLLLEAKAQCEHGQWLSWLHAEFESYSVDTAERYMKVAKLSTKFRCVRNLKLAATTLYELADRENEDDLQAIIKELAKHATKKRLKPLEAERVIKVGIGRRRFGDGPDATLVQLSEFDGDEAWYEKAVAALQECKPETDEAAQQIADKIEQEYWESLTAKEEQRSEEEVVSNETGAILDGPPPVPPPTEPPEPQRIGGGTPWAEQEPFTDAVNELLWLSTKPIDRFVGSFSTADLCEVTEFLRAVAAANKQEAA